ncbi:hypothetical protein A3C18_00060 [Candidatus Kaiserbacteria bacterium RIFCSPHIGHO2_02_FULL_54_11b]|uniref:DUF5678 domain-containing protein n=1 Tax=Candidatus Kaiserbacteria bacterium RIFCSPHIGHO2_02_FULL_54_11b TaxID=1798494 RepID=A0A1F6DT23_9BACT|nr:MAG: hypothetical protein A3C18_00060 [Candidatus Kaiserbacteria bacterium RIFCSPHIGHO2_02_FULL_54_11b]
MRDKNKDFTDLLKDEHYGKWLAVSKDYSKILGFSEDLKQLTHKFKQEKVVYTRAQNPKENYAF